MESVLSTRMHQGAALRRQAARNGWGSPANELPRGLEIVPLAFAVLLLLLAVSGAGRAERLAHGPESSASVGSLPTVDAAPVGSTLLFEPNAGQFDDEVAYLARGPGQTVFLAADGMHLVLTEAALRDAEPRRSVVRIQFREAQAGKFVGLDRAGTITNYFRDDSSITNVPNYERVRQLDVYPGIDVIYYGSHGRLEYDIMVFPGADLDSIRLRLSGHDAASVSEAGDLVLTTPAGSVKLHRPIAYQHEDGERIEVPVSFRLAGNELGFDVGSFDASKPLVIDPILSYSTYVTGSMENLAGAIAVDEDGNAYITGETNSTDFPKVGAYQTQRKGYQDAFITKIDANGGRIIYSTYFGGKQGATAGRGIAIDALRNAYITGVTTSSSLPTTSGAYRRTIGPNSGFVAKLNPQGNALLYSTFIPGGEGAAIAVDAQGSAFVAGTAYGNFSATSGGVQTSAPNAKSAFVAKLNAAGSAMVYATFLGGASGEQSAAGVAIDAAGNAYVAGRTSASDFPIANAYQASLSGRADAFVAKLNPTGSALVYSTYLGGALDDFAYAVAVDGAGNAHVVGTTYSANYPVMRAFQSSKAYTGSGHEGLNNAFITKLNAAGDGLVYSSFYGGQGCLGPNVNSCQIVPGGHESARAVSLDAAGNAYLAGTARSLSMYQPDPIQSELAPYGGATPFVAKVQDVRNDRAVLSFSTILGRREYTGTDSGANGIAVDRAGNAYVVGHIVNTAEGAFPITPGAFQPSALLASFLRRTVVFKLSPGRYTTIIKPSTFQPTTALPVTLTATVSSAVPGGVVTFANKGVVLGTAPVEQGSASFTTALPLGIQELTATYSGDNKVSRPLFLPVSQALVCN